MKFKTGDKVVCKESHKGSQNPTWHCHMDGLVGAHGTVHGYVSILGEGTFVRVKFSPRLSGTDWCFREEWLELVPEAQKMTQLARTFSVELPPITVRLENGKVTAVELTRKEEPPKKPKFVVGEFVVCGQTRIGTDEVAWTRDMERLIGVPGEVQFVRGDHVGVRYYGSQCVQTWTYLERWLEHAPLDNTTAYVRQLFESNK